MHKQRMALRMIKDVIRLKWEAQLSHEQIAVALGVSKGAVTKYVGLANAAGLDWDVVRDWDERQLVARLLPRAPATSPFCGTRLGPRASRARSQGRHTDAALGGVRQRASR